MALELNKSPVKRIFFYGTLMKRHGRLAELIRSGKLRFVGNGKIEAKLYSVGEYPGAVPKKGTFVLGEVYEGTHLDDILPELDEYEEYDPKRPERSLFVRKTSKVHLESGKEVPTLVYFYNKGTKGLESIQEGKWEK